MCYLYYVVVYLKDIDGFNMFDLNFGLFLQIIDLRDDYINDCILILTSVLKNTQNKNQSFFFL